MTYFSIKIDIFPFLLRRKSGDVIGGFNVQSRKFHLWSKVGQWNYFKGYGLLSSLNSL